MFPCATELELIRPFDKRGNFTIGYVAVIPRSGRRLLANSERSRYSDIECSWKIRGLGNVCARLSNIERRGRFRQPVFRVNPK